MSLSLSLFPFPRIFIYDIAGQPVPLHASLFTLYKFLFCTNTTLCDRDDRTSLRIVSKVYNSMRFLIRKTVLAYVYRTVLAAGIKYIYKRLSLTYVCIYADRALVSVNGGFSVKNSGERLGRKQQFPLRFYFQISDLNFTSQSA